MKGKDTQERNLNRRLLEIDGYIREGTYPSAAFLAEKTGYTVRTIQRDIEYLRLYYDAPLEYSKAKDGYYYTDSNYFVKSLILTEVEVETIKLHEQFLKFHHSDDEFAMQWRSILAKMLAIVPEEKLKDVSFAPADGEFMFEPRTMLSGEINDLLHQAIKDKKVIEAEYWISDNTHWTHHRLEPLYCFFERHFYYLLAREHDGKRDIGAYSINHIQKLEITSETFENPPDYKLSDYLKDAPKEKELKPADNKIFLVELSMHKDIAEFALEQTYYPNQKIKKCDDGTVLVSFRTTRIEEVFRWVLGQGYRVKALNPPELVAMLKKEVRKVMAYYNIKEKEAAK